MLLGRYAIGESRGFYTHEGYLETSIPIRVIECPPVREETQGDYYSAMEDAVSGLNSPIHHVIVIVKYSPLGFGGFRLDKEKNIPELELLTLRRILGDGLRDIITLVVSNWSRQFARIADRRQKGISENILIGKLKVELAYSLSMTTVPIYFMDTVFWRTEQKSGMVPNTLPTTKETLDTMLEEMMKTPGTERRKPIQQTIRNLEKVETKPFNQGISHQDKVEKQPFNQGIRHQDKGEKQTFNQGIRHQGKVEKQPLNQGIRHQDKVEKKPPRHTPPQRGGTLNQTREINVDDLSNSSLSSSSDDEMEQTIKLGERWRNKKYQDLDKVDLESSTLSFPVNKKVNLEIVTQPENHIRPISKEGFGEYDVRRAVPARIRSKSGSSTSSEGSLRVPVEQKPIVERRSVELSDYVEAKVREMMNKEGVTLDFTDNKLRGKIVTRTTIIKEISRNGQNEFIEDELIDEKHFGSELDSLSSKSFSHYDDNSRSEPVFDMGSPVLSSTFNRPTREKDIVQTREIKIVQEDANSTPRYSQNRSPSPSSSSSSSTSYDSNETIEVIQVPQDRLSPVYADLRSLDAVVVVLGTEPNISHIQSYLIRNNVSRIICSAIDGVNGEHYEGLASKLSPGEKVVFIWAVETKTGEFSEEMVYMFADFIEAFSPAAIDSMVVVLWHPGSMGDIRSSVEDLTKKFEHSLEYRSSIGFTVLHFKPIPRFYETLSEKILGIPPMVFTAFDYRTDNSERVETPEKNGYSSVKKGQPPVERGFTPEHRVYSPVERVKHSEERISNTIEQGHTVEKRTYSPVERVYTPEERVPSPESYNSVERVASVPAGVLSQETRVWTSQDKVDSPVALLVSPPGHGKSSVGNLLLGPGHFQVRGTAIGGNQTLQASTGLLFEDECKITCIESPGLFEDGIDENGVQEMEKHLRSLGFITNLIVVWDALEFRTEDLEFVLSSAKDIFGDRILNYLLFVVTFWDTDQKSKKERNKRKITMSSLSNMIYNKVENIFGSAPDLPIFFVSAKSPNDQSRDDLANFLSSGTWETFGIQHMKHWVDHIKVLGSTDVELQDLPDDGNDYEDIRRASSVTNASQLNKSKSLHNLALEDTLPRNGKGFGGSMFGLQGAKTTPRKSINKSAERTPQERTRSPFGGFSTPRKGRGKGNATNLVRKRSMSQGNLPSLGRGRGRSRPVMMHQKSVDNVYVDDVLSPGNLEHGGELEPEIGSRSRFQDEDSILTDSNYQDPGELENRRQSETRTRTTRGRRRVVSGSSLTLNLRGSSKDRRRGSRTNLNESITVSRPDLSTNPREQSQERRRAGSNVSLNRRRQSGSRGDLFNLSRREPSPGARRGSRSSLPRSRNSKTRISRGDVSSSEPQPERQLGRQGRSRSKQNLVRNNPTSPRSRAGSRPPPGECTIL